MKSLEALLIDTRAFVVLKNVKDSNLLKFLNGTYIRLFKEST